MTSPSASGQPPVANLQPLTRGRIEAALAAHDWTYHIDSDGGVCAYFDGNLFSFLREGPAQQILYVRGRWHQPIPIEIRPQLLLALDEWHLTRIWPKAFTWVDDDGKVWVHSEHSVDWGPGATDAQIATTLECSIFTSLALYRHLAERFPITVVPRL
ncbi:MAG: YbjN domain-containing protein [Bifidobacteriaceae bacterium]|jgi:hypothetical protein|nr:YbjN domain-containing protein [Bifidobacteriaceae bacterium]